MSFTKYSVRVGTLNEKLDAYQGDHSLGADFIFVFNF